MAKRDGREKLLGGVVTIYGDGTGGSLWTAARSRGRAKWGAWELRKNTCELQEDLIELEETPKGLAATSYGHDYGASWNNVLQLRKL